MAAGSDLNFWFHIEIEFVCWIEKNRTQQKEIKMSFKISYIQRNKLEYMLPLNLHNVFLFLVFLSANNKAGWNGLNWWKYSFPVSLDYLYGI